MSFLEEYRENGFILIKNFFNKKEVEKIWFEAKSVFALQMERLGIFFLKDIENNEAFEQSMFKFFQMDFEAFANCGKQVQHLISLHKLCLHNSVIEKLKMLKLDFPNISTRPVMYFNHPALAKETVYHTVFPHQDWRSMQGSLDSMVLWLPLVDIDQSMGALEVIPKSHKWGLLTKSVEYGFGKVDLSPEEMKLFIPVEVERGDALFFSSFLIHQSGNNITDKIRWSAHFRYNNLLENTFGQRKFAHPYIYKPQDELITKGFPFPDDVKKIFNNNQT